MIFVDLIRVLMQIADRIKTAIWGLWDSFTSFLCSVYQEIKDWLNNDPNQIFVGVRCFLEKVEQFVQSTVSYIYDKANDLWQKLVNKKPADLEVVGEEEVPPYLRDRLAKMMSGDSLEVTNEVEQNMQAIMTLTNTN